MVIKLTFDLEIYPPSLSYSFLVDEQGEIIESISEDMRMRNIRATFFCTGQYLKEFSSIIRKLSLHGNEIANHTMNHLSFRKTTKEEFLKNIIDCDKILRESFSINPIGFRSPGGNAPDDLIQFLVSLGYKYDSSACRTYIPGWYEGGFIPSFPYQPDINNYRRKSARSAQFVEIPIGTFPFLPIPFGGVFLSSLPFLSEKTLFEMCNDDKIHVAYIHPIDLLEIPENHGYIWDRYRNNERVRKIIKFILKSNESSDMRLQSVWQSMQRDSLG